jgi:hypothetical protein
MTTSLRDGLPDILQKVQTRPLFVMRLDVRPLQIIGATPGAYRPPRERRDRRSRRLLFPPCAGLRDGSDSIYLAEQCQFAIGIGDRRADGRIYYSIFEVQ